MLSDRHMTWSMPERQLIKPSRGMLIPGDRLYVTKIHGWLCLTLIFFSVKFTSQKASPGSQATMFE